jgi:hypothetical protein
MKEVSRRTSIGVMAGAAGLLACAMPTAPQAGTAVDRETLKDIVVSKGFLPGSAMAGQQLADPDFVCLRRSSVPSLSRRTSMHDARSMRRRTSGISSQPTLLPASRRITA